MNTLFKEYLFKKRYLVSDNTIDNPEYVYYSLANIFSINAIGDYRLLNLDILRLTSQIIGIGIPEPFYKGFPDSVKGLGFDELLLDKVFHYLNTYGLGNFDEPGHSIFEDKTTRKIFNEHITAREYKIINDKEASAILLDIINNLSNSSRPLNKEDYSLFLEYIKEYNYIPAKIKSKNTAIRLIIDTRKKEFYKYIELSDTIKLLDLLNFYSYSNDNINKLNLKNKDRRLFKDLIDYFFINNRANTMMCFSKRKEWCGLLHHIHYKPINNEANLFINQIRDNVNLSPYHYFEEYINKGDIKRAADYISSTLGSGALLRHLNYLLSRENNRFNINYILSKIDTSNLIILIQLYFEYQNNNIYPRSFVFNKYNMAKTYTENRLDMEARKSNLDPRVRKTASKKIYSIMKKLLKNKLGNVYIDDEFKNIGIPYSESNTMGGMNVLPKGSRIKISSDKKLRAFTYWEKISDIDLSCLILNNDNSMREISWRTSHYSNDLGITFSGDQTSGYNGGSEYFDIDLPTLRKKAPNGEYLIFADNVFSGNTFNNVICRAGYMLRDINDSGEVYEPKTVKSSFTINCESRFAYLFAIDLKTNEFIWLNLAKNDLTNIAGEADSVFLRRYLSSIDYLSMYDIVRLMSKKIVKDYKRADLVLSNKKLDVDNKKQIHSYDIDKMINLINL